MSQAGHLIGTLSTESVSRMNLLLLRPKTAILPKTTSNAQSGNKYSMYGILIYPLYTVANIKKMNNLNSTLWERIPKNSDDRYHFLEACPPEFDMLSVGLPPFVIDFKKYLTIAPGD